MKKITKKTLDKYRAIVDVWFSNEFNGTAAYKKFYPRVKDSTAATNFSKISGIPEIEYYIERKKQEALKFIEADHKGILNELKRWIEFDITETIGISIEELKRLPVEVKRCIISFKSEMRDAMVVGLDGELTQQKIECVKELRFVSKERAIDMINRHVGFYEVDNHQKAAQINITTTNEKHKKLVDGILSGKI